MTFLRAGGPSLFGSGLAVGVIAAGLSWGYAQEAPGPVTEGSSPKRAEEPLSRTRGATDEAAREQTGAGAETLEGEAAPETTLITEIQKTGEKSISVKTVASTEDERESKMFDVGTGAKIRLNGKPAKLDDLKAGDVARIELSPDDLHVATEIHAGRVEGNEQPERRVVRAPASDAVDVQTHQTHGTSWVGATVSPTPGEFLLITQVTPDSPAAAADLRVGDFIIGMGGLAPPQLSQTMPLGEVIGAEAGHEVSLIVWREHQRFPTNLALGTGHAGTVDERSAAYRAGNAAGATGAAGVNNAGQTAGLAAGIALGTGLALQPGAAAGVKAQGSQQGRVWFATVNAQNSSGLLPGDVIHVVSNQQVIPGEGLENDLNLQPNSNSTAPANGNTATEEVPAPPQPARQR